MRRRFSTRVVIMSTLAAILLALVPAHVESLAHVLPVPITAHRGQIPAADLTASPSATASFTALPSASATGVVSPTATASETGSPTASASPTAVTSGSATASLTPSPSASATASGTSTGTSTATATATPTASVSGTVAGTATQTGTPSQTGTPAAGVTAVPGVLPPQPTAPISTTALLAQYTHLPLRFEPNVGQTDPAVRYLAHGPGYTAFFTDHEAVIALPAAPAAHAPAVVMTLGLAGTAAGAAPTVSEADRLPGVSNYVEGNDQSQWHLGVPGYSQLTYPGVYPGVDLRYHGGQGQLEFDFDLAPQADAGAIRLHLSGPGVPTLDGQGNVHLGSGPEGAARLVPPVAYQTVHGGRQPVEAHYVAEADGTVGLALGTHDPTQPLTVDPILKYGSYLGGSGTDGALAITEDAAADLFVVGQAGSSNFPTTNSPSYGGAGDAFVCEIQYATAGLVFSTFLGGSASDIATSVAEDGSGHTYVGGTTQSTNFPTTSGAYQTSGAGGPGGFVSEVDGTGTLLHSTYLGS
ncbi:MAG TPA: hypothetical protein VNL35_22540, partial [Chloroflexota bacterium]|nr:hypothetical protein [Chloroflexota bacterium]